MPFETRQLSEPAFCQVIAAAPLVSIDLVITNATGQILLGQRRNRPAQGYWFVPGGRIRKNEHLARALERIAMNELACVPTPQRMLGAFDHMYADNFAGKPDLPTHYVALGYHCLLTDDAHTRPLMADTQHNALRWWNVETLLASNVVHPYTKTYIEILRSNAPSLPALG